jgi:hypothetical protein
VRPGRAYIAHSKPLEPDALKETAIVSNARQLPPSRRTADRERGRHARMCTRDGISFS